MSNVIKLRTSLTPPLKRAAPKKRTTGPTDLAAVGLKAIDYMSAVEARKVAAEQFGLACFHWKSRNCLGFIPKYTEAWSQMMEGLPASIHEAIDRAKKDERNARKRLFRAAEKIIRP